MPADSGFYPRIFALSVAALLTVAVWRIFAPFAAPMSWAAVLAFLLFPLNLRLRRCLRGRAGLAAGALTVLAPIVVLLPLSALSIEFAAQISGLLHRLQAAAPGFDLLSAGNLHQFPWAARAYHWFVSYGLFSAAQVRGWLLAATHEGLQRAAGLGGSFFLGALGSIFRIALMLVLLFFFLRDGDAIIVRARLWIPLDEAHKVRLFRRLSRVTRAIVYGTTMTALAQGLVLGIGFAIAGLASPVVFGVIGALVAMLPLGGTALVWVPAMLWLFVDGRWGFGIFMAVWGLMLSGVDNVLKPMLISGRAPVSALVVFIGVLGGIAAFGAIGIIAGPIILSLVLSLILFAEEAREGVGAPP
ncbi:MAG TPA: AI-2E family transporter [Steroidobacteraceae bacterium]|nr:AI-2E family transporter [Steroidobacteraceae bacterium]